MGLHLNTDIKYMFSPKVDWGDSSVGAHIGRFYYRSAINITYGFLPQYSSS